MHVDTRVNLDAFASHDFDRILEWRSSHDGIVQEKVGQLRVEEEISPRRLDRCHGDLMLSSILRSNISFTCSGLVNRPPPLYQCGSSICHGARHIRHQQARAAAAANGGWQARRLYTPSAVTGTICWHGRLALRAYGNTQKSALETKMLLTTIKKLKTTRRYFTHFIPPDTILLSNTGFHAQEKYS